MLLSTILLTGFVFLHQASPAMAQNCQPAGIEGSWMLTFPAADVSTRQLASFLSCGVLLATNAPAASDEAAPSGRIYSTGGHGAWQTAADGSYTFTLDFLYFDSNENNFGSLTITGTLTLDSSGNSLSGSDSVSGSDTSGAPLFSRAPEPFTGTRIQAGSGS